MNVNCHYHYWYDLCEQNPGPLKTLIYPVMYLLFIDKGGCHIPFPYLKLCVFRIPAEIPQQTSSPISRVSNYKADCFPWLWHAPSATLCRSPGLGSRATLATVSRKPRTYAPFVTQTHTGSYWTGQVPGHTAFTHRKTNLPIKPCSLLCPAPSSQCVFELDKVTLINIVSMNNLLFMSNWIIRQNKWLCTSLSMCQINCAIHCYLIMTVI